MSCPQVIKVVVPGPPGIGLPAGTEDAGKFLRKAGTEPYEYELATPDEVGLPQALDAAASPTFAGLALSGLAANRLLLTGTGGAFTGLTLGSGLSIVDGALVATATGGAVTLSMPTGFSVSGSGSSSLGVTFAAGYGLPTTAKQGEWDTAYSERLRWDGGATGLNAATARTSLRLGTAATTDASAYATAAQGAKADTAVQPGSLAAVATSGAYGDLSGRPTLGTAAATDASAYAPAAQGVTNGNSHDHSGGDGAQIAYSSLSGTPSLGGAAALNVGTTTGTVAAGDDARLSDAREWTAATIEQAEAEAGTATTRRAFTAQRVFQAIAAWWAASSAKTKLDGIAAGATANATDAQLRDRSTHTGTQAAGTITGLAAVATSGAYGDLSGRPTIPAPADAAPQALAAAAAIGTSAEYAREDHVHQRDSDAIVIPVGDETTALTAGTNRVRFRMPFAATLLAVRASVNTAPTGSTLIVDINEAGTSVLGTKLSIDATEFSSTTAASAATITDSSLADDAEISIDIDQIGSTVAGAGLKVMLSVRRA
jgi:hypothetical protein